MRPVLLVAPLLAALAAPSAGRAQPAFTPWQVESLLPAACAAANIPSRDCLCLLDSLERHMDFAAPVAVTGDGQTAVLPRAGAGHAQAIAAALRACAPVATAGTAPAINAPGR